ncbi:MAG: hypothetical protein OXB84_07385 [Halobacteriovoraceae bacterium]|nr:hypothetical protein [Halobacteriovoraceae bacterium]
MKKVLFFLLFSLVFSTAFHQAHGGAEQEDEYPNPASQAHLAHYRQNTSYYYQQLKTSFEQTAGLHDMDQLNFMLKILALNNSARTGYCFAEDIVEEIGIRFNLQHDSLPDFFKDEKPIQVNFSIEQSLYIGSELTPERISMTTSFVLSDFKESEYGRILRIASPPFQKNTPLADISWKRISSFKWIRKENSNEIFLLEKREIESSGMSYEILEHDNRNGLQKFLGSGQHRISTTRE